MMHRPRLRDLLTPGDTLFVPGAYDVLSAMLIERAGFACVYMTGFGVEASLLGMPDLGYLSLTEAVSQARNMARAVSVPVIADADVGFGGALAVARTTVEFERSGAAALQIEDQATPKRCTLVGPVTVLSRELYLSKIRAAVHAREDPDFLIIARTDAHGTLGLVEAIGRANDSLQAGADIVMVTGDLKPSERASIRHTVHGPIAGILNDVVRSTSPDLTSFESARALGWTIAIIPTLTLFAAAKAVQDSIVNLRRAENVVDGSARRMEFDEFDEIIGLRAAIRRSGEEFGEPSAG
jgi:2-methylisocitrate lyase-like PEP mutase family enzyme